MSLKSLLIQGIRQIPGWRTKRKIVVFESDDWGSIRMPSKKIYELFLKKGIPVDKDRYNKFDTLASKEDLSILFDVLCSVRDSTGSYAKFTPLSLVANPDFERIRESNFQEYFYEELPETLKRYGGPYENSFSLWLEGIEKEIFVPQFHGREHLNVFSWLQSLRAGSPETRLGFENQTFGLPVDSFLKRKNLYMSAFEFDCEEEFLQMPEIISDGAKIFEKLFGYKPIAFMAPCGIWSRKLEPSLSEAGISLIQSGPVQYEPFFGAPASKYIKPIRYTGKKNKFNQIFTVRNCKFETSTFEEKDWVDSCLTDIRRAFSWKKPAIISTHRVNFIGGLVPENRNKGLRELKKLLQQIVKSWPDVEFMTSDELGETIISE